jgi:SAM-dependent methyltransferase
VKSWDVLASLNFIREHVKTTEPILDIGCFASELIVALHKLGYTDLWGADLNPNLSRMPYSSLIHYENVNFMETSFANESFQAITATSVIEHGFDAERLLTEISRLLKPGGYFIASFDFWPTKIDTSGIKFFGMDWKIFSKEEVAAFIYEAATYHLEPVGRLDFSAQDPVIKCGGEKYTFGWLVMQKSG